MRQDDRLVPLANWFSFTWEPLGDCEQDLMIALARDLRGQAYHIVCDRLPEEHGQARALAHAFREGGWLTQSSSHDENHILELGGRDFTQYWASRPGRMRTTLKRKQGRIETDILTSFDPKAWQTYTAIYAESWKPVEERADLLEDFAATEASSGHLRLGIARHEGEAVAAQFWTVEDDTAYIHKLAHTPSGGALSAGTVLSAAMFRHAIDVDGVRAIDFGTGSDAYKRDWMETCRLRYRVEAWNPRSAAAWPGLVRARARRLAERIRPG